jgi:MoaA/NifB/PqqE/SkfB family radical SAM enzyme
MESLSLFVGSGKCNANCGHCAGVPLRKYFPKEDGVIHEVLIYKTIRESYKKGARYLSVSSSGEPTLSPKSITRVFEMINELKENEKIKFNPINLYSNGIKIGSDEGFANKYLGLWKDNGLTTVYITVHDIDEKKNAEVYGVKEYPSLEKIVSRIHDHGLLIRGNIVLSKKNIGNSEKFISMINSLDDLGFDKTSAWPIRNLDDKVDVNLSPSNKELNKMQEWIKQNNKENYVRLLREDSKVAYKESRKLTLFPNGVLSNTWCN